MINYLNKRQRFIAAAFFGVFYLDLVATISVHANSSTNRANNLNYLDRRTESDKRVLNKISENAKQLSKVSASKHEYSNHPSKHDIDGPGQPEMNSFKSAGTSDMVDLFTGDFSYNIPLLDVGGYPVNIHYGSGISMDQEPSWVGLGWNINPGTISRNMRGLPDDFNGDDSITRVQNIKENRTVGASVTGNLEIKGLPLGLSANLGVFHNTYNGWGTETGLNVSINAGANAKGPLSASLGLSNNSQTGLDLSPSLALQIGKREAEMNGSVSIGSNYNSRSGVSGLQLHTEVRKNVGDWDKAYLTRNGPSGYMSFATPSITPTITMPITNTQFSFTAKGGAEAFLLFPNGYVNGYVTRSLIATDDQRQKLPAYGYLNFSKASTGKVLLDFNREKDIPFNQKTTPHIAIPQYTYDLFSISGEGTGGMFRPYRGDVGYIFDHAVKSKSSNDRFSFDLAPPSGIFHTGVDISNTTAITESGVWKNQNDILDNIRFQKSDSSFEEVYFRNPGEKSINASSFYNKLGGDSLIRVKLVGEKESIRATSILTKFAQQKKAEDIAVTKPIIKDSRDKRTQVITYLNAKDARSFGLDSVIKSYYPEIIPVGQCVASYDTITKVDGIVRKANHISEIRVLNADGRRYVYGLPVYNVEEEDVTLAVRKENDLNNINKGFSTYLSGKNSVQNDEGKDGYYNKDSIPAYAHSFLLTGLLSPDYIDIKGDGITDDDLGDAVKFNYSQVYGKANDYYNWRTPSGSKQVSYNEGLKSYSKDDKGTYMFGKKEVWYLHSLESKTMIAVFKTSDREDACSVNDENGGLNTSKKLKRLDSIELYVKADVIKNGQAAALPIKTVHFEYSYELSSGVPGSSTGGGKLTLKTIYFTYNGNNKGKLNPYRFYYHPDASNNNLPIPNTNPSYNAKNNDRWGTFKDPSTNFGNLSNTDFPYTVQDADAASLYASAWHLTDIKLPSGGRLNIAYEADDYAYVQNKRATCMFQIAGFGEVNNFILKKDLYLNTATEYSRVFVKATVPVTSKTEIYNKYLEGISKIYFKVAVQMPSEGYDFVPTYGEIANYGIVPGNTNMFYIDLVPVNGQSPILTAAIQFLRLNLPSKAYPNSEPGDNVSFSAVVKMLASGAGELVNAIKGFDKAARTRNWCKHTIDNISFIRLNSPDYRKLGGGVRVKRVKIYDNWNAMTTRPNNPGLRESEYGQEYFYKTSIKIGDNNVIISSGVASYEPMLGGEENPFHIPIEYTEKVAPLAPTNYAYTEMPLGESFFPSAMVGYSQVRVRTINAKAKSANGWEETGFYTTKDFPTQFEATPFDGESKKRFNPGLSNFLRINAKHFMTISQGFKVELNDMNGKMRFQASYPENDSLKALHYTENFYKVDDDKTIPKRLNNSVWAVDSANGHINTQAQIGKEVEVMVDVRQQLSTTTSHSFSPNVDIIPFVPPINILPIPSSIPLPQREEDRYRSVAVVKIVQRYGILDSILVIDKGSTVSTKNIVYDAETGNVLLSRTNNEFDDPVYNFSYPAHWAYSGMDLAYKNVDVVLSGKTFSDGKILTPTDEKFFESGDEIIATGLSTSAEVEVGALECPVKIPLAIIDRTTTKKIWAIAGEKAMPKKNGIYFIDEQGKPYTATGVKLRILRSGKRNMTDASIGNIVSLQSPVRDLGSGNFKIVIDSNTRVINTSATTFKDQWKVDNSMYEIDSCYTITKTVTGRVLKPVGNTSLFRQLELHYKNQSVIPIATLTSTKLFVASSFKANFKGQNKSNRYNIKSVIKFDLSSLGNNAVVSSALLYLPGGAPQLAWSGVNEGYVAGFASKTKAHYLSGDLDGHTNESRISQAKSIGANTTFTNLGTTGIPVVIPGALDQTCDNRSASVTSIVNNFVLHPESNYGFVITLAAYNARFRDDNSAEQTLSFCGGEDPNGSQSRSLPTVSTTPPPPPSTPGCVGCDTGATLTVSYTYSKDTCVKLCRNYIKEMANPYRWGILGNWRNDRAYVFYHDRKEFDASTTETNIRKDGELKSFAPYWQMNYPTNQATTDESKWVWNSAITQFNRKGFETENVDPLGRYNSGLYGYNSTLPVAVAQNAKYREILFDGFEDYNYKTRSCDNCETPKEFDFLKGNSNASIQQELSHTGRYSIKVNANSTANLVVPVSSVIQPVFIDTMKVDSTPKTQTVVVGKGTKGLSAVYKCLSFNSTTITQEAPISFTYNTYAGLPNCSGRAKVYGATWTGKIQPKFSDLYTFSITSSITGAGLRINGMQLLTESKSGGNRTSKSIRLLAGQLYDISITYPSFMTNGGGIDFFWSSMTYQASELVPKGNLYPPDLVTSDTAGSVSRTIVRYCVKMGGVWPINFIPKHFSPVQGSRLLVTAWINTNQSDCVSPEAVVPKGEIAATFNQGTPSTVTLLPTGVSIEGWQRYEAVMSVPETATQMTLALKSSTSVTTYFDDIRVQPFNSQMKSFVYDPINLRLMAELDENNYASFYEYDDDGTLIRVKKETERGIKTIKETRSALFKE